MPLLNNDKSQFSVRLNADDIDLMNEFIKIYEDIENKNLNKDKEIFVSLLQTAVSNRKTVIKDNPELLNEISKLKSEIEILQSENSKFQSRYEFDLKNHEEQQGTISNLLQELDNRNEYIRNIDSQKSELENKLYSVSQNSTGRVQELERKISELQKAIPLYPSEFQKEVFKRYANDNKTADFIEKFRKDGIFDSIKTDNENERIANLLKTVTLTIIHNQSMPNNIYNKQKIKDAIKKYENELTQTAD